VLKRGMNLRDLGKNPLWGPGIWGQGVGKGKRTLMGFVCFWCSPSAVREAQGEIADK